MYDKEFLEMYPELSWDLEEVLEEPKEGETIEEAKEGETIEEAKTEEAIEEPKEGETIEETEEAEIIEEPKTEEAIEEGTVAQPTEEHKETLEDINSDIDDLELLLWDVQEEADNIEWDSWLSEKLTKAVKTINKLQNRIADLELEKAEMNKFGDNNEDDSVIIIKSIYEKVKDGDEWAINKFKKLIKEDTWFELQEWMKTFVNDRILNSTDVNINWISENVSDYVEI